MEKSNLDPRLRLLQQADMKDKVVLLRVDHNVVKRGKIDDPYRIDTTLGTLYAIAERGGRPILMTHIGRPKDKKTGNITCKPGETVAPVVRHIEQKLPVKIGVPELSIHPEAGIVRLDDSIQAAVQELKSGKWDMIYLPNTRWFQGEESKGPERDHFARWLGGLADLYVNDAFGSWQAHGSTYDVTKHLPSYAGILLQKEISHLQHVLEPERPFVAVIAGSKYDTKIEPLTILYQKADHLILGGVIYNTFVAAKYGVEIAGVSPEDKLLAKALVDMDSKEKKIVEMPYLVESDTLGDRHEGGYRTIRMDDAMAGKSLRYILDVAPASLEQPRTKEIILSAKTLFVNAVMGLTPSFFEGTQALYKLVASNGSAVKLFGGGDTLLEFRNLCPYLYLAGLDAPDTYYFTGGGSVLEAINKGSPYGLKPVQALMEPA